VGPCQGPGNGRGVGVPARSAAAGADTGDRNGRMRWTCCPGSGSYGRSTWGALRATRCGTRDFSRWLALVDKPRQTGIRDRPSIRQRDRLPRLTGGSGRPVAGSAIGTADGRENTTAHACGLRPTAQNDAPNSTHLPMSRGSAGGLVRTRVLLAPRFNTTVIGTPVMTVSPSVSCPRDTPLV